MIEDVYHQRSYNDSALFKIFGKHPHHLIQAIAYSKRGTIVCTAVLSQVVETAIESIIGYQFFVAGWGNPLVGSFALNFLPLLGTICKLSTNAYETVDRHPLFCSWFPSSMLFRL